MQRQLFENTPTANAKFFLETAISLDKEEEKNFEKKLNKLKEEGKTPEYRLLHISKELKQIDVNIEHAGYAIGTFYHVQNQTLGEECRADVRKAKTITLQRMSPEQYRMIAPCSLEKFYEHMLESYRSMWELQKQHIILFSLSEELKLLTEKEQLNVTLRKLTVYDPHKYIVQSLLEKGADPTALGDRSRKSAIDIAQNEGFNTLAAFLLRHVEKSQQQSTEEQQPDMDQLGVEVNSLKL